jgi:hypothetical protein
VQRTGCREPHYTGADDRNVGLITHSVNPRTHQAYNLVRQKPPDSYGSPDRGTY